MNINLFKPAIENQLTTLLGREVKLGDVSLSVLSGTVDARDLAVADDPQFSPEPFITATVLHIGVQMRTLILQQQILIESLEIEAPRIHLVRASNGGWNVSTLGQNAAGQPQSQRQRGIPDFTISSLRIKNGRATFENFPSAAAPLSVEQIDLSVDDFAMAKQFPFTLSALLPGQATLTMNGKAGPINLHDPAKTNFDLNLAGDKLPIDELQSLLPAIGIKLPNGAVLQGGSLAANLKVAGSLQNLVINGPIELADIRLSGFKPGS